MKCWIVQRPVRKRGFTDYKSVVAYFSKGAARGACVPNFDDRVVEGYCLVIEKSVCPEKVWKMKGASKPAKKGKAKK